MARPKLTPGEVIQRELENLSKLTGKDFSHLQVPTLEVAKETSRQAEATAEFIRDPNKFVNKLCKVCHRVFLVNYPSVGMCSDQCRREYLEELGILWAPEKRAEERWAPADVPLTVPPDATYLLMRAVGLVPEVRAEHQSSLPKSQPLDELVHTQNTSEPPGMSHNMFDVSALVSLHAQEKTS